MSNKLPHQIEEHRFQLQYHIRETDYIIHVMKKLFFRFPRKDFWKLINVSLRTSLHNNQTF